MKLAGQTATLLLVLLHHASRQPLQVAGRQFHVTCVSMGNPHCVTFVDEITDELVFGFGPKIEHDPRFPNRVNAEFRAIAPAVELQATDFDAGVTCG